jgi:hypothetical protein
MKKLFRPAVVLVAASISFTAFAGETLENCMVTKMLDTSVLEESFTLEEYPDVTVEEEFGSLVVSLGANTFENDAETRVKAINVVQRAGSFGYEVTNLTGDETFTITGGMKTIRGRPTKVGKVSYRFGNDTKVLAEISCD